ncbi:Twinfilin-1 [Lecanora helva]
MQSGITVSKELRDAFNDLVSSPSQRGLVATIESEALKPLATIPSQNTDFHSDLSALPSYLQKNAAAYIILSRYQNAPDGFVAVTYIPDSAPVRQKMLFASTRLTLVRELGTERFRESMFVTEIKELEQEGWRKHEASGALKAPLTEEEESLKGIKESEAEERGGTAGRRLETGGRLSIAMSDEARIELEGFKESENNLLQLVCSRLNQNKGISSDTANEDKKINVSTETIELAETGSTDAAGLSSAISATEPRFTFFKYTHSLGGSEQSPILFIYTCPSGSKIKERMVYASSKQGFLSAASSTLGIEIVKKLEASSPSEITEASLEQEFRPNEEQKQGFARPKRPGKR